MKTLVLIFSALLATLSVKAITPVPQNASSIAAAAVTGLPADDCECTTWLDESVGRWTVYVKNTCEEERIVDCWYVVELVDGTKDTRTATLTLRAGATSYIASDFTSQSHCIEHGCSFREDQQ